MVKFCDTCGCRLKVVRRDKIFLDDEVELILHVHCPVCDYTYYVDGVIEEIDYE